MSDILSPPNVLQYSISINEEQQLSSSHTAGNDDVKVNFCDIGLLMANAKRLRQGTLMYREHMKQFKHKPDGQLLEVAVIISIKNDTGEDLPTIIFKMPDCLEKRLEEMLGPIPYFCYPDFKAITGKSISQREYFVITLTDPEGSRSFAYCCRYQRELECPAVLVFISPLYLEDFYFSLLEYAADTIEKDPQNFRQFLEKLIHQKIPKITGIPEALKLLTGDDVVPQKNYHKKSNFATALLHLGPDRLVLIFSSLLAEKRILLVSDEVPVLTEVIQGVTALLHPFEWPHTLIPVVPQSFTDLCYCPSPFIMGVLRPSLPHLKELLIGEEDILIVDIKMGIVRHLNEAKSENLIILPKKFHERLTSDLKSVYKKLKLEEPTREDKVALDRKIHFIFIGLLGKLVGHYRNCVLLDDHGHTQLHSKHFLDSTSSKSHRQFLSWLVETGLFQIWIEKRLRKLHETDEWNLQ